MKKKHSYFDFQSVCQASNLFLLSTLHIKVKGLRTIHQSFKPDQPNRFGPTQRVTNNFKRSSTYYLLLNVSMSM